MSEPLAQRFFKAGYLPLVPVIPPGAQLSPNTRITTAQLGKVPGVRGANGTWYGFDWQRYVAKPEDVKAWGQWAANVGLLAAHYPGLDIDCLDPWLAEEIERIAKHSLGLAPVRTGRAPKRLLMYRTGEPFSRVAAIIHLKGEKHLVEFLGSGRQYLIGGTHPSGAQYTWDCDLPSVDPNSLTWIELADVQTFFAELRTVLELIPGVTVEMVGDGKAKERGQHVQEGLLAPSIDALRTAVATIPNSDDLFPTRDDYIKVGVAIKAAAGEQEDEGYEIFADWCGRHETDGRVEGNPETWLSDWRRLYAPFSVGWSWLAQIATQCGFNAAAVEFEAEEITVERDEAPPLHSDAWLSDWVVSEFGDSIRYVPATGKWYVWNMGRWQPDAVSLADHYIGVALRRQAALVIRQGVSPQEQKQSQGLAKNLCSAARRSAVRDLMQSEPRITAAPEAFDGDPWQLNTPGGIVDLKTGDVREHDRDALCSRQTLVTPDFEVEAPLWAKFLREATRGDLELQHYLQRLAGYALTGSTEEHMLAFIWGPGGNGKGVFLNAITNILKDYAEAAPMDSFTAGMNDKHPTDMAGLVGARLVTASETQSGRRWDEARIKALTGGDPVRARFMRQDFFTYQPQFTLVFSGNHKPEIRDIDAAMRRRIHLVPFVHTPEVVDLTLGDQLRDEYPAILAWMIRGCQLWQQRTLSAPPVVEAATREYFADEDPVQRWLDEACEIVPGAQTKLIDLYASWEAWANARGEFKGTVKRLAQHLVVKGFPRCETDDGRKRGFEGLRIISQFDLEGTHANQ